MTRLTEITGNGFAPKYERETQSNYYDLVEKLGQLEDIEEEFGIDLIKLLNAKKVYYMDWNRDCSGFVIKETEKLFINLTDRTIECYHDEYDDFTWELNIKDYGKNNVYSGWAFTREELENE